MIPRTGGLCQTPSWQAAMANAFTSPEELIDYLELDRSLLPAARAAALRFGLRVPRGFVDRMQRGNPQDPLLLQVLPMGAELELRPGFVQDPVGDLAATPAAGVVHKYHGRALLITTGACALHCRYCFRRHFPYQEASAHLDRWQAALDYLGRDASIKEVILSGGDPMMIADSRLAELFRALEAIPHLTRLRIHTRMPIIVPQRITEEIVEELSRLRLKTVVVVHCNHARELTQQVCQALKRLEEGGVRLLNQSVLLKGINDELEVQVQLCEVLFDAQVLPYYLHLLDPVQGAAHFNVSQKEARLLYRQLQQRLPGYLLPKLVYEKAGEASKIPVTL
ncbi:MAG: EF-P beta-lysylation protein EpmB [Candidatus Polarisedimenticolaceae bacterium]|nr:EF-P beta-lysylation protein EpmB [Candidatus Polarisedimenticolaceae bacterium]